jgi:hypothetical protein
MSPPGPKIVIPLLVSATNLAERGTPKYETAAMRWLERYITEGSPRLRHFAEITASLAQREL